MSVMNVKRATTFAKGDSSNPVLDAKSEGPHAASAQEFQKTFGDQNLGDIANKITDPNWVDPSKKMRAVGNPTMDKDAFMKLMLAQMKHQDPTKPMESHEMAAQLAQFTSLEQLNNIHTTLESMKSQQAPQTNYQALALIGKKVSGDASKVNRAAGDTKHGINFDLVNDASKVRVSVKDANGTVIRKLDVANLKKGRNTIEWNGLNEDGTAARPGEYKISVEGSNKEGKKVFAKTAFEGRITGLNYTPEGPVLLVGNSSIKLADVKKIEDAGPEDGPAPSQAVPGGMPGMPGGMSPQEVDLKLGSSSMRGASPGVSGLQAQSKYLPIAPTQQQASPGAGPGAGPGPGAAQKAAMQKMAQQAFDAQEAAKQADAEIPPAEESDVAPGNIANVPMAGPLLAKISREIN